MCVCLRVHAFVRKRESERVCAGAGKASAVFLKRKTEPASLLCLSVDYTTTGDSPFGLFRRFRLPPSTPPPLTLAFEGNTCARESQDNGLSPGKQGGWMTSVDDGLAGGKRETADHGLPALVNGVRDQRVQQAC